MEIISHFVERSGQHPDLIMRISFCTHAEISSRDSLRRSHNFPNTSCYATAHRNGKEKPADLHRKSDGEKNFQDQVLQPSRSFAKGIGKIIFQRSKLLVDGNDLIEDG